MRILTTGRGGKAGSWTIRGYQLGGALGNVQRMAGVDMIRDHDVVMVVKRIPPGLLANLRKAGKPWIWDLVDFYPQPECGTWSRDQAIDWVHKQLRDHRPDGVIYPTQQMADDIGAPGIVVYHHHRPYLNQAAIKPKIATVGYEGCPDYLGRWRTALITQCAKMGFRFTDKGLPDGFDVVVAVRDKPHRGYVQQHWKSNVKLANAHGAAVPFIGQRDAGYLETQSGYETWIERYTDITDALETLANPQTRTIIAQQYQQHRITIKQCAERVQAYAGLFVS